MNGGHDLGGKQGLGPIDPEPEQQEPVFHADWERRVFALTMATGMLGQWNIDEARHARERQHPADYLKHSYYENWLKGLEKLLVEKELLDQHELENHAVNPASESKRQAQASRIPDASDAKRILTRGGPTTLESDTVPKFAIGSKVRVRKTNTAGHTRSPSYAQGSTGTIVHHFGCAVFPDKNSRGERVGEQLYSVRFTADSLWGTPSDNSEVLIDMWEPYLDLVE